MKETKAKLPLILHNQDGSVTVKFREPIPFGEETFSEIKLRKPKAKDLKGMKLRDLQVGDILNIASRLCGESPAVLDEMGMADAQAVLGVVSDFLEGGGTTGPTG